MLSKLIINIDFCCVDVVTWLIWLTVTVVACGVCCCFRPTGSIPSLFFLILSLLSQAGASLGLTHGSFAIRTRQTVSRPRCPESRLLMASCPV